MKSTPTRRMALTTFVQTFGYHAGAWRRPESRSEEIGHLSLVRDIAQAAERAKLHAVFFADTLTVDPVRRGDNRISARYDPIVTMGALAACTDKIGLIGSLSTTFAHPFNAARHFQAIDTLSDGRAGWNIVTSITGNLNFGMPEMPDPETRYRQATEFVEVCKKLWTSWEPGAVLNDRERGVWADGTRIHDIDHVGEFFDVRGGSLLPRSPQVYPVLVQAGQSPAGVELGSSVGDAIYTAQPIKDRAVEFYAQYKARVAAKGRDPEKVKILPAIMPIVGETQAEADEIANDLASLIDLAAGRAEIESVLRVDTRDLELDERIPAERVPSAEQIDGPAQRALARLAGDLTIRQMAVEMARAQGHQWVAGTPASIAERMIGWFDDRACDGFSLNCPYVPDGVERTFELLVPELQERGYFQHEYSGDTMRERMGLEIIDA